MDDLISRQDAIDAVMEEVSDKRTHDFNAGATRAANKIKTVPSAQVRTQMSSADCISRQDALDEIQRFYGYLDEDMINRIHIGLNRLPSAQEERKKGRWIEIQDEVFASTYRCSECGSEPLFDELEYALSNYCPNCGSYNGGKEE